MNIQQYLQQIEAVLGKETMLRAMMGDAAYEATIAAGGRPEIALSGGILDSLIESAKQAKTRSEPPGAMEWERRICFLQVTRDLTRATMEMGGPDLPDVPFPVIAGLEAMDVLAALRTFGADVLCKALEFSGSTVVVNAGTVATDTPDLPPGLQRNVVMMTGEELHKAAEPFLEIVNRLHDVDKTPGAHIFAALLYSAGCVCGFENIELDARVAQIFPMMMIGKLDAQNANAEVEAEDDAPAAGPGAVN